MERQSKQSSDYLNIARDYLATDSHTDAIHEDTEKEFPIWGIPPEKTQKNYYTPKQLLIHRQKRLRKFLVISTDAKRLEFRY